MVHPPVPLVRPATSVDLPALTALINAAYEGTVSSWTREGNIVRGPRTSVEDLESRLEPPNAMLVAELHGALCGCVYVESRGDAGYIGLLSVAPSAQGQKLGARLMQAAEDRIRESLGMRRSMVWVVSARTELVAWYERLGYVAAGQTHPFPEEAALVPGLHFVVMEKALPG